MSPSKKINSKAIKSNMKLDKYHNATIYQLVCSDKNATLVYIGHTTNFKTRMSIHKYECNHKEGRNFNLPLYKYMRANGGCDNWEMIALERCRDKEEALRKEREWILKTPLAINKGRPLILNRLITKLLTDYARKRKEAQQKSKKEYDKEYRATRRLLLKSNTSASNEDNQYMRLYRQENKGISRSFIFPAVMSVLDWVCVFIRESI
jgi:predicted GIY-YIG superfamily endonuclease